MSGSKASDIVGYDCVDWMKGPPWTRFKALDQATRYAKATGCQSVWMVCRQTATKAWDENGDMRCAWPEPLDRREWDWDTPACEGAGKWGTP